eukprot:TRINITY_DN6869_c0_g1_i1.p1 TRINITY_DN6869_c0_g1~~TRINITY_DN6869_c0_g1_i1.p1  ORF type:complete len:181 (-),score=22.49 TRINITY_DN6869_c0_g1_i1:73-615(-)
MADEKGRKLTQDTVQKATSTNPHLVWLLESMKRKGCFIPDDFYKTKSCPGMDVGAYFDTSEGGVVVCDDKMQTPPFIEAAMIHETIHAFDYCRAHVDPNNCLHVACTEIRAANLSGDCFYGKEFLRGNMFDLDQHHQACVRRRAEISVGMQKHCGEKAADYVDQAWRSCFNDWEPFDNIP